VARELPRILRRAGVRVRSTEGFHPKPDLSFGPALALGTASLDERFDCRLSDAPGAGDLVLRLNRAASDGLRFLSAERLGDAAPAIGRAAVGGRYVIAFAEAALADVGGRGALEARLAGFLDARRVEVRRDVKGIGRTIDVRSFVRDARIGGEAAAHAVARAGIVGRVVPLEVTIALGPRGSAKIVEVVEALLGDAAFPHVAVRVETLLTDDPTRYPGQGSVDQVHRACAPPPVQVATQGPSVAQLP
jgi:radical SAM-linked protein